MALIRSLLLLFLIVCAVPVRAEGEAKWSCIGTDGKPKECVKDAKWCINKWKGDELVEAACDSTQCEGAHVNNDECVEKGQDTLCCCKSKKDCNVKTFNDKGVKECLDKTGTNGTCTRDTTTLALPAQCYNHFKDKSKTIEEAGCDKDGTHCKGIKGIDCREETTHGWDCCCIKDNCNIKDLNPEEVPTAAIKSCLKKDFQGKEECKPPKHACYNKWDKENKIFIAGCDTYFDCFTHKDGMCFTDPAYAGNKICCCYKDDCNDKKLKPKDKPTTPPHPVPTKSTKSTQRTTGGPKPTEATTTGAAELKMVVALVALMTGVALIKQ